MLSKKILIEKGFQELGVDEDDIFYKIRLRREKKGLAPDKLSGSFNEKGEFDLYGYGILSDEKELNKIFKAIETLSGNKMEDVIYNFH